MRQSEVGLLTIQQASEALGLKTSTLRAWIAQRRLGYGRLGKRAIRIHVSEINRIIERGTVPARQEQI